MVKIAELGEKLVAQWLSQQNWLILHHRFSCRWGEIDLIAKHPTTKTIAFVEVKTRRHHNWDNNGILAINSTKQAKISRTAAIFLSKYPHLAEFPCRFDVALVVYKPDLVSESNILPMIDIGKPIIWQGYCFTLDNYIESAFVISDDQF